jgi:HTH-type transcriptional regulator/antitoxin HipB
MMSTHANVIQRSSDLSRVIREARLRQGVSQQSLATQAGIAGPALSNIELAKVDPRLDSVLRILGGLGLELIVQPRPAGLTPQDVWK